MDFFEVVAKRRSIRKFTEQKIPEEWIEKALSAAVLAPNSSNVQTWDFYWVKNIEKKAQLVQACLNQAAARTASDLVVITADPKKWHRSQKYLLEWVDACKAPKVVRLYYDKLIPFTYRWGLLNSLALIKWIISFCVGLFRPIPRGPNSKRDLQEVALKSAALAAENFVLAMTAQGADTCMMEGFDEWRVKRLLRLSGSSRVVMVVGVGYSQSKGTWGPQYRIPADLVIHRV